MRHVSEEIRSDKTPHNVIVGRYGIDACIKVNAITYHTEGDDLALLLENEICQPYYMLDWHFTKVTPWAMKDDI